MTNTIIILNQMVMLFGMMAVGYFLWKKEWLDEESRSHISRLTVNILNPALIISSVIGKELGDDMDLMFQDAILMGICYGAFIVTGLILSHTLCKKKEDRSMYQLMTIFQNSGFMGIPIIRSMLGDGAIIYLSFYILAFNVLLFSYGIYLARRAARECGNAVDTRESLTDALRRMISPSTVSCVVALLLFFLQIPVPETVETFCDYMGDATIPMAMILIGIMIAKADLKEIFLQPGLYIYTALRMLAMPIAVILLAKNLNFAYEPFMVFAIQIAMPLGTIVPVVAEPYGANTKCAVDAIVLTTLVSFITIPVCLLFA